MWRDAQVAVNGFRERLRPKLSFVYEPDIPPYLHEFRLTAKGREDQFVRLCRIGIRNDSAETIRRVRVVIKSVTYFRTGRPFRLDLGSPRLWSTH